MAGSNNGPSIEGVVFPFLTLLTILLSIAPFIWHIKHRNLPASSLVFWIVLVDIFYFINALIWPNDDLDSWWRGYGLCDLEVKLQVAATIGIPTSLVCIMRNLARVLDTSRTVLQPSPAQRRRQYAIEALLCFGAPVYMIIAHYVVQNVRYYIFGISGCVPSFDNSWPSIVLIEIWSPFFSVVAVYYSIIVVIRMRKYRKEFAVILSASSSGLTKSRFLRLFFMSLTMIVLGLPVQFYVLYENTIFPLVPYSWSRVHGPGWWDVILIPTLGGVTFDRWIQLAVGFTVFVFFGLGHDMKKMYRNWLLAVGFGRILPSLGRPTQQVGGQRPNSQSESYSSRAHTYFMRKFSRDSCSTSSRIESITRSSFTASPSQERRPSAPLDPISEKPAPPATAKPCSSERKSSRFARFLALIHISGPYSSTRALSLFARPSHVIGSLYSRPSMQVPVAEECRSDQGNRTELNQSIENGRV